MSLLRLAVAAVTSLSIVASQAAAPAVGVDVLTQHNDTDRTGWNPRETALTPASVTSATFGKLFDLPVDGLIYTQPLVVSGVPVSGGFRDLVLVATQHNSVYAFDANMGDLVWKVNVGPSIPTPNRYWNTAWGPYLDLTQEVGITSTPVVDRETLTLYFTSVTWQSSKVTETPDEQVWQNDPDGPIVNHHLHAVDLATGAPRPGAPVKVQGSVPVLPSHAGRHDGPTRLTFNPMQHLQRAALLLVKGRLVAAFGSHADQAPYQGWVFAYDTANLGEPPWMWSTMAGGAITQMSGSGIWQAGMGLTADADGNVYLTTGNGPFDPASGNYGDAVVKLSMNGGLAVADYFSPCNQACLEASDGDLGASGVLRLPGTNLFLAGGKPGKLHLLDGANLGKFAPPPRAMCASPCSDPRVMGCANSNVLQEFQAGCDIPGNTATIAPPTPCSQPSMLSHAPPGTCPPLMYQVVGHHIHGSPVYWKGDRRGPVVYVWAENDVLRAFPFNQTTRRFTTTGCATRTPAQAWTVGKQASPSALHFGMTGGMLSISSSDGDHGIVWATTPTNNDANQRVVPGILRAYDADDLGRELWNSYQARDRDDFGNFAKHTPPTIANGKVYVATFSGHLSVYGLNPPPPKPTVTLVTNGDFESGGGGWTLEGDGKFDDGFPYYGTNAAALCPSPDRAGRLWQELVAPDAGAYVLTAYIATNIRSGNIPANSDIGAVTIGVEVDGTLVGESDRAIPYAGYQRRTVEFTAAAGSRIRIRLQAPMSAPLQFYGVTPAASQPPAFASIDSVTLIKK
jgi:outer membrane protein assembly factor BamB